MVAAMARALLKQRSLPARYWGEAVVTAVYLLNRALTKTLQGKAPYEAWHGKMPAVGYLRTFGCVAYTKDLPQLKKLDDRSRPDIFIGYVDIAKAYRMLDPATQRVCMSWDVIFDESRGWDWVKTGEGAAPVSTEFVIEYSVIGKEEGAQGESSTTSSAPTTLTTAPATPTPPRPSPTTPITSATLTTLTTSATLTTPSSSLAPREYGSDAGAATKPFPITTPPAVQSQIELATPLEDDEDRLDAFYDDEPLWYRKVTNILGDVSPPDLAPERSKWLEGG
jgi:hypothetical protein